MSTQEMKQILIDKIQKEEDENVLYDVIRLLDHEVELKEPEIIYLTEQQKKGVYEGLEDIKAGRYSSQEQVDKELDEFFKDQKWKDAQD